MVSTTMPNSYRVTKDCLLSMSIFKVNHMTKLAILMVVTQVVCI